MSFLLYFYELRWQSNDDVGMGMIAHGYGISQFGSANILFSNILWGKLIRLIPEINGVLGYSIISITVLFVVGLVIFYSLLILDVSLLTSFCLLSLILIPNILAIQFTINAGLLAVSSILSLYAYNKTKDNKLIYLSCFLAFLSYLERSHEFIFILFLALPLVSWPALRNKNIKASIFILIIAIGLAALFNNYSYKTEDWKPWMTLNPVRAPFTDYDAATVLEKNPTLLAKHQFSINDIRLIKQWFFLDPSIADPSRLSALLKDLGALPMQHGSFLKGLEGVKVLFKPELLMISLLGIFFSLIFFNYQILACWVFCFFAAFSLGFLGRPDVGRVFIPAISLLLLLPFIIGTKHFKYTEILSFILIPFTIFHTFNAFSEAKKYGYIKKLTTEKFVNFPSKPVVIWGGIFPYSNAYPVLKIPKQIKNMKHYGLGTSSLAPYSLVVTEEKKGNSFLKLITKRPGIILMADPTKYVLLKQYCSEHYNANIHQTSYPGASYLNQIYCA
ncbi:hypothetical protein [Legionella sp. km772]|uniref:hypothetical protein n=1 Tax=Legionella sp. km772 TaxID=2498111 RepID=UPI000F8EFB47|nr:hypothetical protein [Legionella sp. km772]RUR12126.1 hypothetical protein ELY15_06150 [Legionella sp. km772]